MRVLVAISFALLAFAGAAAWVVDAEPDWYLRTRYPLEYEHVIRAYAHERDLDPLSSPLSSTPRVASIRMCARVRGRWA